VRENDLFEIKSAEILQPGPAALTDGVRRMHAVIRGWATRRAAAKGGGS
jgi:iron complex transport system substrate-binding protein